MTRGQRAPPMRKCMENEWRDNSLWEFPCEFREVRNAGGVWKFPDSENFQNFGNYYLFNQFEEIRQVCYSIYLLKNKEAYMAHFMQEYRKEHKMIKFSSRHLLAFLENYIKIFKNLKFSICMDFFSKFFLFH